MECQREKRKISVWSQLQTLTSSCCIDNWPPAGSTSSVFIHRCIPSFTWILTATLRTVSPLFPCSLSLSLRGPHRHRSAVWHPSVCRFHVLHYLKKVVGGRKQCSAPGSWTGACEHTRTFASCREEDKMSGPVFCRRCLSAGGSLCC